MAPTVGASWRLLLVHKVTATGELNRVERVTKFTKVLVKASLVVPSDADEAKAMRLLEKAETSCLITNSMNVELSLEAYIKTV